MSPEQAQPTSAPQLAELVRIAAHHLPAQAPLHAFVHHNTLHALEHLPFHEAVEKAATLFGAEPYPREAQLAEHLSHGRISPADIDAVVAEQCPEVDSAPMPGGLTGSAFTRQRLKQLFEIPEGSALRWLLVESDALFQFHPDTSASRRAALLRFGRGKATVDDVHAERRALDSLWSAIKKAADHAQPTRTSSSRRYKRPALRLLETTNIDVDELVKPLLIRWCNAFLDQGVSYWSMPRARERTFLDAIRELYGRAGSTPDVYFQGLAAELQSQAKRKTSAEETVRAALDALRVPESERAQFIESTLLVLPGWAGMIHHLEHRPEDAPIKQSTVSLLDYLALQLTVEVVVIRNVLRQQAQGQSLEEFLSQPTMEPRDADADADAQLALAYEAFISAQLLPITPESVATSEGARLWLRAHQQLHAVQRRRLLHMAYERRYRNQVLNALASTGGPPDESHPVCVFQALLCIDDREESLRRHIEEQCPESETFGYAGFFGVAMQYRGLDDVRPRPLCPGSITARHLVVEQPRMVAASGYKLKRRLLGDTSHALGIGSKALVRGGLFTSLLGSLALIPLVLRTLFPRTASGIETLFHHSAARRPPTQLQVARDPEAASDPDSQLAGHAPGYTPEEMAQVVSSVLRTSGMASPRSKLVLVIGHGSSSINNPHEYAYNCGATGGGCGGFSARAFAAMANDAKVRETLRDGAQPIPEAVHFVGMLHNTCDDTLTYYDEHDIPAGLRDELAQIKESLLKACKANALERCRRFELDCKRLNPDSAYRVARTHAAHLAEARPEYNHATNALCIVGRRARTRGVFLDRRAFLVSYDPLQDADGDILRDLLLSVAPVGAGINLEYYFSTVDPKIYGCGSKLPHNIAGLIGVMEGHSSDLRPGLSEQMVEIHEPMRLLVVVESTMDRLEQLANTQPAIRRLVGNGWVQLVAWSPSSNELNRYTPQGFIPYQPETTPIPQARSSGAYHRGTTGNLPPAFIQASAKEHRVA